MAAPASPQPQRTVVARTGRRVSPPGSIAGGCSWRTPRGNLRMSIGRFLSEWDGIVFVLGKPGEEDISTYPLALPRPDVIQPELLGVGRLLNPGASATDLAIRSQLR